MNQKGGIMGKKRWLFFVMVYINLCFTAFGLIKLNYTHGAFNGPDTNGIKEIIKSGASAYMRSFSHFQYFLALIEQTADSDNVLFSSMVWRLDQAIDEMRSANTLYNQLVDFSETEKVNPKVIKDLETFNYDSYLSQTSLNMDIFNQVKSLLSQGDIAGIYQEMVDRTAKMLILLKTLKEVLGTNSIPPLNDMWRLNQSYCETMLYGQYVAEICFIVTQNQISSSVR